MAGQRALSSAASWAAWRVDSSVAWLALHWVAWMVEQRVVNLADEKDGTKAAQTAALTALSSVDEWALTSVGKRVAGSVVPWAVLKADWMVAMWVDMWAAQLVVYLAAWMG